GSVVGVQRGEVAGGDLDSVVIHDRKPPSFGVLGQPLPILSRLSYHVAGVLSPLEKIIIFRNKIC
ncbi:MAG TPA: hypothetical protein H9839_06165, partial [Candidatus Intestinimonas stercorigallinarum]|nr:hypothetical protein [Candidatus Intestinimonas stercorigallinarum]